MITSTHNLPLLSLRRPRFLVLADLFNCLPPPHPHPPPPTLSACKDGGNRAHAFINEKSIQTASLPGREASEQLLGISVVVAGVAEVATAVVSSLAAARPQLIPAAELKPG